MWPDLGAVRDGIIFNLLNMAGGILWTIDRLMIMIASILHWFRVLLVGGGGQDNLLGIMMTQLLQGNELLKQLVYLGIMLAFTILSFTLIARPLIGRVQAVDVSKVVLWFFIAVLIFSAGPGMVSGLESTRLGLQEQAHLIASTIQYQNEINHFNNEVVPDTVGDFWLPGQTAGHVPHLFGTAVGSDCPAGCNGLDAAAAFLGAEEGDITGARAEARNTGGYPEALYVRYFTWREGNEEERAASLRNASEGVMRLLEGIMPALFSIIEAAIFFLFGVAAMLLFISLPVAIPFAFFSLTEVIAASVLRAYLFLVLRTFVVATMMAFLVQMLIIFAERGTVLVFVSISGLTMLLSFQFVHMAAGTVAGALNVIGSSIGSATGASVRQTDPLAAAGRVAGMAVLAGAAVATGGGALLGAATLMQRQGGVRGGGLQAVGSAALHAARVRAGAAVGRTPLSGLKTGYAAVHTYHRQAREHAYDVESARALLLDGDAEEAAGVLTEQRGASGARKRWAVKKMSEWTALEKSRETYRRDMRAGGMERMSHRGYSTPWKRYPAGHGTDNASPGVQHGEVPNNRMPAGAEQTYDPNESGGPAGSAANVVTGAPFVSDGEVMAPAAPVSPTGTRTQSRTAHKLGVKHVNSVKNASTSTGGQPALAHSVPDTYIDGIETLHHFRANDPTLRATAQNALFMQNKAVGVVAGYLVVYSGAVPDGEETEGLYEIVPANADLLDLLQSGKHMQKSGSMQGRLVAWEPPRAQVATVLPELTMWSGADSQARKELLADVRALAESVERGLPLNEGAMKGRLSHLSGDERGRFARMLQSGSLSPGQIVRVLERANKAAEDMEKAGDEQMLLSEFVGPNGYLDLASPAAYTVLSGAAVGVLQADGSSAQNDARTALLSADDVALLLSTGLGLKRALHWTQVKGALEEAVYASEDAADPAGSVSERLGVTTLRTSMAPIRRFVDTARHIGLPAEDVATLLDVASASQNIGEVISALSEKDETKRHLKWRVAGMPSEMLRPMDSVWLHARQHTAMLSPAGAPQYKAEERAQEMLGTLLAEGASISSEIYSVPIETYSGHPYLLARRDSISPEPDILHAPISAGEYGPGVSLAAGAGRSVRVRPSEPASRVKRRPPARFAPLVSGKLAHVASGSNRVHDVRWVFRPRPGQLERQTSLPVSGVLSEVEIVDTKQTDLLILPDILHRQNEEMGGLDEQE